MTTTGWWVAIGLAYLSGSVPYGLLIGKAHGIDLRTVGSGNIGATNCGREVGSLWGKLCFVCDFLKGFVPVIVVGAWAGLLGLASITTEQAGWWTAVAGAAVCGHVFPVWLGFRGGKGVATAFGALVGVWPVLSLTAAAGAVTWVVVTASTRFVSLGSIVSTAAMAWYAAVIAVCFGIDLQRGWPMAAGVGALAVLVLVRHRGNLSRVLTGTEDRVGDRKKQGNRR